MNENRRDPYHNRARTDQWESSGRRPGARARSTWLMLAAVAVPVLLAGLVAFSGVAEPGGAPVGTGQPTGGAEVFDDGTTPGVQLGQQGPTFTVRTLSGEAFTMPSGKPTILTFVDLCPTCIQDTRNLAALQKRFDGVAVLAVASDPTADKARVAAFMRQAGDPGFALALDPQSTLTRRFDAFSMAASVVVADAAGRITYRGPVDDASIADALVEAGAGARP